MINLKQIKSSVNSLGIGANHIEAAIVELESLAAELDEVEVKGRRNVDTLLGCMMAIDAIIGKEEQNG